MKCLHCGHCCLTYAIVVIKDPDKVPRETDDNIVLLDGTKRCPHLQGNKPGMYLCAIHDYPWFKDTPCGIYGQIENKDSPCRIGAHILKKEVNKNG